MSVEHESDSKNIEEVSRVKTVSIPGALGNRDVVVVTVGTNKNKEIMKIVKPNGSVNVTGKRGFIPEFVPPKRKTAHKQRE